MEQSPHFEARRIRLSTLRRHDRPDRRKPGQCEKDSVGAEAARRDGYGELHPKAALISALSSSRLVRVGYFQGESPDGALQSDWETPT